MTMLPRRLAAAAFIAAIVGCSDQPTQPTTDLEGLPAPGTGKQGVIVMLAGRQSDARTFANDVVKSHGGRVRFVFDHGTKGFSAILSDAAVERLRQDPRVAYIGPIREVRLADQQVNAPFNISRIDNRDLPYDEYYDYSRTGSGVTAYIIDTGIRTTHNQFGGRASVGYDAVGGDGQDCSGHGTHVAGTVGGSTYGVAKQVSLVAVRVIDCNSGTPDLIDYVIAGIDWVIGHHASTAVANLSIVVIDQYGTEVTDSALDAKVGDLISEGVTAVIAAGNTNKSACLVSPARVSSAITVGATSVATWEEPPGSENWLWADIKASFSNFGTCLDIFAVGYAVQSAWWTSNSATQTLSGTSMAAPEVTGVAAMYLQASPSATPSQVASAIISNATLDHVTSAGTGSPNRLLYSNFF